MIKAIVTDIEGTTSSLSFVRDVLFPYARERLASYVRAHGHEPAVRVLLRDVAPDGRTEIDDELAIERLLRWMDEDKKIAPLKSLQGMIWEQGYRRGHFKGHVYEDAVRKLNAWHERGLKLYVYSSGSVHAQKLLFGNTDYGDLNPLFSGYFDTHIGAKQDAASYRKIAERLGLDPVEILFLSDILAELDAARAAGMDTVWLVRDGTLDATAAHRQAADFDHVAWR
jgi:enolase-phosphatase E1